MSAPRSASLAEGLGLGASAPTSAPPGGNRAAKKAAKKSASAPAKKTAAPAVPATKVAAKKAAAPPAKVASPPARKAAPRKTPSRTSVPATKATSSRRAPVAATRRTRINWTAAPSVLNADILADIEDAKQFELDWAVSDEATKRNMVNHLKSKENIIARLSPAQLTEIAALTGDVLGGAAGTTPGGPAAPASTPKVGTPVLPENDMLVTFEAPSTWHVYKADARVGTYYMPDCPTAQEALNRGKIASGSTPAGGTGTTMPTDGTPLAPLKRGAMAKDRLSVVHIQHANGNVTTMPRQQWNTEFGGDKKKLNAFYDQYGSEQSFADRIWH